MNKFAYLNPPPFYHQTKVVDPNDVKVSQWLKAWDGIEGMDAALVGVPLSK